jgi:hypothetical protein
VGDGSAVAITLAHNLTAAAQVMHMCFWHKDGSVLARRQFLPCECWRLGVSGLAEQTANRILLVDDDPLLLEI